MHDASKLKSTGSRLQSITKKMKSQKAFQQNSVIPQRRDLISHLQTNNIFPQEIRIAWKFQLSEMLKTPGFGLIQTQIKFLLKQRNKKILINKNSHFS